MSQPEGNLASYEGSVAIITCLVRKLGGKVDITQDELDANVGSILNENSDGASLTLKIIQDGPVQ